MTQRRDLLLAAIAFEWRYHTRHPSFLVGLAIFAFFGFFLTMGLGGGEMNANSPAMIVEVMALLSLVSVFPLTVFSANAILRDREYGMEEIVFTTAVEKRRFLFTRFTGVLLASFSLMLCAAAGMLAAPLSGMIDAARVGATIPSHYLQAFAFIVVPNLLFAAVLVFAIAALTRSAPASYVGSVVIYLLYFVAAALTNSPLMAASESNAGASLTLAALLDPIGLSAFFEQIRYWTILERNSTMVALSGNLLTNRLIWTATSFAILGVVVRAYPFRLLASPRKRTRRAVDDEAPSATSLRAVEPRPRPFQQFLFATRLEIRLLMANGPFVVLLLAWIAFVVPEVLGSITSGEYGSPFLPMTSLVVGRLFTPLSVLGTIAMIYWSSESFWRERTVRFDPIVAATPVAGPALFASRLAALSVMVLVIASMGAATGIVIQLARGGAEIDPLVYLGFLALGTTPLILFAAGCGVIHILSPNKYAGMLFCFALAAFMYRGHLAGIEHHLLRFATMPPVAHSDMTGFSDPGPFAWFSIYWALVAAALALFAGMLWRRHDDESLIRRLRSLTTAPRSHKLALLGVGAAAVAVGAFIFTNTNVINRYETSDEILDWKADYEKTWGSRSLDMQPRITSIETKVDFDPDARALHLSGQYLLTNRSLDEIEHLLVSIRRDATRASFTLDGRAPSSVDERFGMHSFDLSEPLAPGASVPLRFDVEYAARGFSNDGTGGLGRPVVSNGSFILSPLSLPGIGYRKSYEIVDARERAKRALPARSRGGELGDELGGDDVASDEWVTTDITMSTKAGQTALAPGTLVESRREGDRELFRYRSEGRLPNILGFVSARYELTRARHGSVDIEIYSHPGHERAVPAILETARVSLDTFSEAFGPYPHRELRIAEVPSSATFGGFATPGLVMLNERRVFYVDTGRESPVDLLCRRVAHEIAHQWWGHHVRPATVDGGSVITESITKFAETLVLERLRGGEQVRNLREIELDRYLSGRAGETEPALFLTKDQAFLYYSKGLLVLSAIRELVGPERLGAALAGLVEQEAGPEGAATTLDLLDHLHRVATPDQAMLIDDWMKEVVLYDLAIESASSKQNADGTWKVSLQVRGERIKIVEEGREEPLDLDEDITFQIETSDGAVLEQKRRLTSGRNQIRFIVEDEPVFVNLDPDILRIDRNRMDNVWRFDR